MTGAGLARFLTELPPRLRWKVGAARTALLHRPAFAHLGAGSVIVAPLVLRGVGAISLGERCAIYEGAWLECALPDGSITVGDRLYLGHRCHLHAVDPIRIGDGCMFADDVMVSSGDHPTVSDRGDVAGTGPITIGDDVFLGQRAIVLGGVTIGDGATVGAGAVVTRDVAPGGVVVGVPARPIGRPT